MEILYFNSIGSTQDYLVDAIRNRDITTPVAVVAREQTKGRGSRQNSWESMSGNLLFSFAVNLKDVAPDMPLSSASIYFSYIFKEELRSMGSKIWLKWPNDLYLNRKKVGGIITSKVLNTLICGIGLNINSAPRGFEKLDIEINNKEFLDNYFKQLKNMPSWKKVFSNYEIEFAKSIDFQTYQNGEKLQLSKAKLMEDGALVINGEKVRSNR